LTCPACGTANLPRARFCIECGTAVAPACPSCGTTSPPTAKFCSQCATRLHDSAGDTPPPAREEPALTTPVAERRHVSILFADLVGFTPFAEERDPEEVRDTLDRYFNLAREVIERYGGTIEKFIGDAVMAVWGAPTAREDDSERAVRAALDLVDAVPALGPRIQARAAVLSGEAAVTLGATGQAMVAGDLVNTASRLQGVAPPGSVLVGESTYRSAQAAIAFEPAGDQLLKGKTAPVPAYRALRVVANIGGRGRSEGLEPPFVGRDDELRLLKELYHATTREQRPRLVSVIGPAGIGKSRLAWEFSKYTDGLLEQMWWHSGRSPAYGEGITFWALGEMIRRRAGLAETDDEATTIARIGEMLAEHVPDEAERRWIEPAMQTLLGVGESGTAREELFGAWRTFFERLAITSPVVLLFEELHWADAGLLDFIDHLLEWSRSSPIYIVTLARPELLERRPTWGAGKRQFTSIYLEPLPEPAMRALLAGVVPGLPEAAARAIVARADGVPLYAVETIRMLVAEGRLTERDGTYVPSGDLVDFSVPETLTALIAARLDTLEPEQRALLQDASVLGQSFTLPALAATSGLQEAEIERRLPALIRRELLIVRSDPRSPDRGQYAFVQSLIREVGYNTLARADRKSRHLAAARYFESLQTDELAGALAGHYVAAHDNAAAGAEADALAAQARIALKAAAHRAISLGSPDQAYSFLSDALRITQDPAEQAELALRAGEAAGASGRHEEAERLLALARDTYRGLDRPAAAVHATARLARELLDGGQASQAITLLEEAATDLEELGDNPARIELDGQLARAYFFRGDDQRAIEMADRVLRGAERADMVEIIADTLVTKGTALYSVGRSREGHGLITAGAALAESGSHHRVTLRARINAQMTAELEDPRAALESSRAGLALARRLGLRSFASVLLGNAAFTAVRAGEIEWAKADLESAASDDLEPADRYVLLESWIWQRTLQGEERAELIDEMTRLMPADPDPQDRAALMNVRAIDAFASGRLGTAASAWREMASTAPGTAPHALASAARASLLDRDRAGAESALDALLASGLHGRAVAAVVDGIRGGVAALGGETAASLTAYRSSLRAWRDLGLLLDEALTGLEMATLLDHSIPEVAEAVEKSRATFELMRARPLLEWLEQALADSGESARRPAHRASTEQVEVQVEDALA
jgi:class 3 adenylate cyclase/tetratricopeptide (TPR) repeat protein